MDKTLFANKIAHYATREPKHFLQIDGHHIPTETDSQMAIDVDGDAFSIRRTVELMQGSTTRVLIPLDTDHHVVIRQLKKIAKKLRRNEEMIKTPEPASVPLRPRAPWDKT